VSESPRRVCEGVLVGIRGRADREAGPMEPDLMNRSGPTPNQPIRT